MYNVRHPTGDDCYSIVIIGQGLQASSNVKFEIDVNYELIPTPESSLSGLETPAPVNDSIPALQVGHLKSFHQDDIVRIITSYDLGGSQIQDSLTRRPYPLFKEIKTSFDVDDEVRNFANKGMPSSGDMLKSMASVVKDIAMESIPGKIYKGLSGKRDLRPYNKPKNKNNRKK